MKRIDAVVYDIEIVNCVPDYAAEREPDLTYCEGWHDKAGMGVAVVAALDLRTGEPHVYLADNLGAFVALVAKRGNLVGFNSKRFDDGVMAAAGFPVATTYDFRDEFMAGRGKKREMVKGMTTLDALCKANGLPSKALAGAQAPKLWQRQQRGIVIDYCLGDVYRLARLVMKLPDIIDPATGQTITVRLVDNELGAQAELMAA